jgi:hypothetical protein
VVLSDIKTSWLIPSSRGRIVAALHYEFFVADQARRQADLEAFFADQTRDGDRVAIVRKYHARWLVLNAGILSPRLLEDLLVPDAVVSRAGGLTLLDAKIWARRVAARSALAGISDLSGS